MTSPLLALFARSLREETRGRLTYVARAGLIAFILLFLFLTQKEMGWSSAPGLVFFGRLVFLNAAFIVLAGLSYFASAITEEKEEVTLGLLRMTNLNPLSILLGKSTSRVLGALLLLAAQLPFTLLAVSLGGVSLGQIAAAYCTLAAFIVLMSNLALLCSVVCRRTGGAAALTALVLFGAFVVVPVLGFFVRLPRRMGLVVQDAAWVAAVNRLDSWIKAASPFHRLGEILRSGFADGPWCWQVGSNLALGAGCFLLAWAVFDVFCREQPEASPGRGLLARRTSIFRRTGAGRPWGAALAWKDFHFVVGGKVAIAAKFLLYPLPFFAMRLSLWPGAPRWRWHDVGEAMFGWMLAAFLFELSFAAARVFRVERQWKTLSALTMLPRSIASVAYEKILGCLPALTPAVFWMLVGASLCRWPHFSGDDIGFFIFAVCLALFFLHLVAWLSLRMKRGALAVAIGMTIALNMFCAVVASALRMDGDTIVGLGIIFFAFDTMVLHAQIGARLEAAAAED
jgi:hypothetical protein